MNKPPTIFRRLLSYLDRIHADSMAIGGLITGAVVLIAAVTLGGARLSRPANPVSKCYACEEKDRRIVSLQRELDGYERFEKGEVADTRPE